MRNILITGGAGFIGSNLSKSLVARGYAVTVLDTLSEQIHGENPLGSPLYLGVKDIVTFVRGSVTDKALLHRCIAGADAVVHLAAETGTGQSMYEVDKYSAVNLHGTALIFDYLANNRHTVRKLVVASSRSIYGEGRYSCVTCGLVCPDSREDADMQKGNFEPRCPHCHEFVRAVATDEDSMVHPSSFYGLTKQVQESMFLVMGKALSIPTVALRYQNVYGPGQSLTNPYTGILSIFSTRILGGKEINIFEDGEESRDFVYVDDVVQATMLALENQSVTSAAFNVGCGVQTSVLQVVRELEAAYQIEAKHHVTGAFRLGDIRHNYASLDRVKGELGFSPTITFREGIKRFTDWVKTQAINGDRYDQSLEEMRRKGLFKQ